MGKRVRSRCGTLSVDEASSEHPIADLRYTEWRVGPAMVNDVLMGYVDLLNHQRIVDIPRLFGSTFVDHDPLVIPGFIEPQLGVGAGLANLEMMLQFLATPDVDFQFTLEDSIVSANQDRIAYRLFGQGIIRIPDAAEQSADPISQSGTIRPAQNEANRGTDGVVIPADKLLGTMLSVEYCCTGFFRIEDRRISERWGVGFIHV